MNDSDFLRAIENNSLDPKHFDHYGHLRLAWLYLSKNDLELAVAKVCSTIKTFGESLGVQDKFNLTLTDAIVRIMAKRMAHHRGADFEAFLAQNQDLVTNALSVLFEYYSKDLLLGEEAKSSVIAPDIKVFEAV